MLHMHQACRESLKAKVRTGGATPILTLILTLILTVTLPVALILTLDLIEIAGTQIATLTIEAVASIDACDPQMNPNHGPSRNPSHNPVNQ